MMGDLFRPEGVCRHVGQDAERGRPQADVRRLRHHRGVHHPQRHERPEQR